MRKSFQKRNILQSSNPLRHCAPEHRRTRNRGLPGKGKPRFFYSASVLSFPRAMNGRRLFYKQRLNVFACSYIGKRLIDVCNPIACRKAADLFVPLRMAKHKINISCYVVH